MPEYISRETAIANIVAMTAFRTAPEINSYVEKAVYRANGWIGGLRDALIEIGDIPSADVVEVVRCRECVFGNMPCAMARYPDYFCADGKRKDGGTDDV